MPQFGSTGRAGDAQYDAPAWVNVGSHSRYVGSCSRYGSSSTIQLSRSSGTAPGPKHPGGNERPAVSSGWPADGGATGRPFDS